MTMFSRAKFLPFCLVQSCESIIDIIFIVFICICLLLNTEKLMIKVNQETLGMKQVLTQQAAFMICSFSI